MDNQNKTSCNVNRNEAKARFIQYSYPNNASKKSLPSTKKQTLNTNPNALNIVCFSFVLIIVLCVMSFGLNGCGSFTLFGIFGSSESSRTQLLRTSANDIRTVCPIPPNIFDGLKPKEVDYWPTEPGYYRLKLETYCLHAGTYGPTEGTGFQLLQPKGPLAPHIKAILLACADHPHIKQQTIQRLLWAMLGGIGYDDLNSELRSAATLLLPSHLLAEYIGLQTVAPELVDAALPTQFQTGLSFIQDFRKRVNDINASFEEIERMAVLDGDPPGPPVVPVPKDAWSLTPDGCLWRIRSSGYSRAYADYYIPYPEKIERDEIGRITYFELLDGDGYSIESSYKPEKYYLVNPTNGREYPIWCFERVIFRGPDPNTGEKLEVVIEDEGWVFARETYPMFRREVASLFRSSGNDYFRLVQSGSGTRRMHVSPERMKEIYDQAHKAADTARYVYEQADQAGRPLSNQDLDNITDIQHYENGMESLGKPQEQSKWFHEHQTRVVRAWQRVNQILGGLLNGKDGSDKDNNQGGAGLISQPGNSGRQRIGTSNRFWSR